MRKSKLVGTVVSLEKPLVIEKMLPTGQGLATADDGIKVFLWNVLSGEEVLEYSVTKKKAHFVEGIATKLAKTSADRVEPRDASFLSTSPWQILSEEAEMREKGRILAEIFREFTDKPIAITGSPSSYFYRNKMEYALYYDIAEEKIKLAVHARGSHLKVPVTSSSIERPEIWARACEIVDELNAKGDEARRYQSLLLRCDQRGRVSGGLFENKKPHPVFPSLSDTILGREYSYSPNGFFQVNLPVYEAALRRIREMVDRVEDGGEPEGELGGDGRGGERRGSGRGGSDARGSELEILDLYSGVGTIGLSVAGERKLTLVEVDAAAYGELEKNAARVRSGATTILAKSEEVLECIEPNQIVIVDPPRAGCDEKLIDRILKVHPRKIIYLSCNPATQVRDLMKLRADYSLRSIEAFNFFPRTPHIECLVELYKSAK